MAGGERGHHSGSGAATRGPGRARSPGAQGLGRPAGGGSRELRVPVCPEPTSHTATWPADATSVLLQNAPVHAALIRNIDQISHDRI